MFNINKLTIVNGGRRDSEGGISNSGGTVIVSNSTFSGNTSQRGGGIYNSGGTLTVSNSTFSGNSAEEDGRSIYNSGGMVTVSNGTLSDNSAWNTGSGIKNDGGSVTLTNTIVGSSLTGENCSGSIIDGGGNLSFGDSTCPGINGDPKLGPLQNNGGPTLTMALESSSAAIDAANDAACATSPVNNIDQRGYIRPSGAHCDIGAYEFVLVVVSVCDEAHLLDALSTGGRTVTFICSGTIPLSSAITTPAAATIVDGSGQSVTISASDSVRMFFIPADRTLTLRHLTFAGGQAVNDSGGAIYNLGSLVVANSTFRYNAATFIGGAIYNEGSLVVASSTFEFNRADFHGGAIVNYGTLDVSDSGFFSNEAGINGGAIDSIDQLGVHRSYFIENAAGVRGGAINNYLGTLTVEESVFDSNSSAGYGGGLVNDGGRAEIQSSLIVQNSAQGAGGGIYNSDFLDLRDSTFLANNAGTLGGGLANIQHDGFAWIERSTFSGNRAQQGGGIANDGHSWGGAIVFNSTLAGNRAALYGGGIYTLESTLSDNSASGEGGGIYTNNTNVQNYTHLESTIVASSPAAGNCAVYGYVIIHDDHNLSFGDTTCPGINGDPLLGPLQDNGGPTDTMALGVGSAAIDAAAYDGYCRDHDQRGVSRPQGPYCDIGAYEVTVQPVSMKGFLPIIRITR